MRKKLLIILIAALLFIFGCSSANRNPSIPAGDELISAIPNMLTDIQQRQHVCDLWQVVFNLAELDAHLTPERDLSAHYNVTSLLPQPFIRVNSYDPVAQTVNVDVTIRNRYQIDGYDVRLILYTDNTGHTIVDPDDWTGLYDIPGGLPINPFRAYNKQAPNRLFAGGTAATENLNVKLPGGNMSVKFAIDACFPDNCPEPYMIDNFTQYELFDFSTSSAEITVDIYDWQNNITGVFLQIPQITGQPFNQLSFVSGNTWSATITNSQSAPAGNYPGIIAALSGGYFLYDYVLVIVTPKPTYTFDITSFNQVDVTPGGIPNLIFTPNGMTPNEMQDRQYGLEAAATGPNRVYAVYYGEPGDVPGVYMATSDNNGNSWNSRLIRSTPAGQLHAGVSIDVIGSEVFLTIAENTVSTEVLYLGYNNSNGDGDFSFVEITHQYGFASSSVAVDPNNTNNVYVGVGMREYDYPWYSYLVATLVYTSHDGPSGPFTQQRIDTHILPPPWNYHCQAYTNELKVAPDGDVYLFETANSSLSVYKSADLGVSFGEIYNYYGGIWRNADAWFEPDNPEKIHWVIMDRSAPLGHLHIYKQSSDGGVTWTHDELNRQTTPPFLNGYTNSAVCTDGMGNAYLVYTDKFSGNGEVYGRFVPNDSTFPGDQIQISTHQGNDANVEIVPTTDRRDVIIIWLENLDGARKVVSRKG